MKKMNSKDVKLFKQMFEGQEVSLAEARKILIYNNRRDKVMRREFGLTQEEVLELLRNNEKVKELAQALKEKSDSRVRSRIAAIESKAIQGMRDPKRVRQMRALLAPR